MCGRFAATLPPATFKAAFGYDDDPWFPQRFNIAPTQPIAIVGCDVSGGMARRRFELVRWGFVPAYVKDFGGFKPIFNAWREGLPDKPAFRNAVRRRRCLVLADGYYVWQQREGRAHPLLVRRVDGGPVGLAGLKESWAGADGSELDTACIITTPAEPGFVQLHPRRPVIIDSRDFGVWLEPDETQTPAALPLLDRPPGADFEAVPIGPMINKAANGGPEVQVPTGPPIRLKAAPPTRSGQADLF